MKITEVTLTKQLKMGLPGFSNITTGMSVTAQAGEGEEIDHDALLDLVNQKLGMAMDFDPSWIRSEQFKHHYRITVKIPKKGGD